MSTFTSTLVAFFRVTCTFTQVHKCCTFTSSAVTAAAAAAAAAATVTADSYKPVSPKHGDMAVEKARRANAPYVPRYGYDVAATPANAGGRNTPINLCMASSDDDDLTEQRETLDLSTKGRLGVAVTVTPGFITDVNDGDGDDDEDDWPNEPVDFSKKSTELPRDDNDDDDPDLVIDLSATNSPAEPEPTMPPGDEILHESSP